MNFLDRMAYDSGGYTVQEILSSFSKKILEIIDLVNKNEELCDEARTLIENIRNEVVPDLVDDIMKEMQDSGYFDSLVNVTLIEQLRTELTTLLNQAITDFTTRLDNFDSQLDDIVNLYPTNIDDTENIKNAILNGKNILFSEGTFIINDTINLPNDRNIIIKGKGLDKTILKVNTNIDYLFYKDLGKVNGSVYSDFTVDGNMKLKTALRIKENKQAKISRIRCTGMIGTPFVFGCEETTGSTKFYEASVSDIQLQNGYYGSPETFNRGDYGIELLADTTDSVYNNIVINNIKKCGIKTYPYSVCNTFNQIHVYGYPDTVEQDYRCDYALDVNGDCIIGQLYSDCVKISGVKIRGGNVNISNSRFLQNRADNTASCVEIDDGVGYISIINNSYVGQKEHPIKWLGSKGQHINIFGNTPEFDRNLIGNDLELQQSLKSWDGIRLFLTSLPNKIFEFVIGDTNKKFWRIQKDNTNEGKLNIIRIADSGEEEIVASFSRWSGLTTLLDTVTKSFRISSPVGTNTTLDFEKNSSKRWRIFATNDSESGTSTGSNFNLARYNNTGGYIDAPFNIERESGNINMVVGNVKIQGTWEKPLIMNGFYIWVSSDMKMRIKSSMPTKENDGTVLGSQT